MCALSPLFTLVPCLKFCIVTGTITLEKGKGKALNGYMHTKTLFAKYGETLNPLYFISYRHSWVCTIVTALSHNLMQ